ncbi:hypothetical protein [Bradyrhizobium sp. CCGUVB23]|uniref:hypothetical protein n=1 Tax=Bradyrhizobium sp. CCGUVB23 TaxID=2949630 RepID=UPI0020B29264|nr:hypothetical protein [Bradyrhizobium sp. CCGUVB23]MCP3460577.1 hypothetical protein [Bradyrhizobium sp. CCGUVB23]
MATAFDSIFDVIEHHRELSAQYDAAVSISAELDDGPEFGADDAISDERLLALQQYAAALIHSKPTTLAGVIALSRYVASLPAWLLSDEYDWHQPFLTRLADALDEISAGVAPDPCMPTRSSSTGSDGAAVAT